MKNKKAQGEIITTVLIILLVLAAIVIVWQVVNKTVTKGGIEIGRKSDCIGIILNFDRANQTGADNVIVRRGAGGQSGDITVYILPAGASKQEAIANTSELEVAKLTTVADLTAGQEIKAGAKLTDGTFCDAITSTKVVAGI